MQLASAHDGFRISIEDGEKEREIFFLSKMLKVTDNKFVIFDLSYYYSFLFSLLSSLLSHSTKQ